MNTTIYLKGMIYDDRKEILKKYYKSDLLIDLTTFASLFLSKFTKIKLFSIIFLVRAFKLFARVKTIVETQMHLKEKTLRIIQLINLFITMIFLSHLSGCIWHFIGQSIENLPDSFYNYFHVSKENSQSWLVIHDLYHEKWEVRYSNSLFYSILTMATVGIITIKHPLEQIFSVFLIILLSGVFAYSINTIGIILQEIKKNDIELKNISYNLQIKIRKYLQYMHEEEKNGIDIGMDIAEDLSESLKEELKTDAYYKFFKEVLFLSKNFSENFIKKLCSQVFELTYGPGEEKNECFGIKNLFSELIHENYENPIILKNQTITHLLCISSESFKEIIKDFPNDSHKMFELRDKIEIYKDYSNLYEKCISCNNIDHSMINCPKLHYIPNKEIIAQTYFHKNLQKRFCGFIRKNNIKQNSKKIYKDLKKMMSDNGIILEEIEEESPEKIYSAQLLKSLDHIKSLQMKKSKSFSINEDIDFDINEEIKPNVLQFSKKYGIKSEKIIGEKVIGVLSLDSSKKIVNFKEDCDDDILKMSSEIKRSKNNLIQTNSISSQNSNTYSEINSNYSWKNSMRSNRTNKTNKTNKINKTFGTEEEKNPTFKNILKLQKFQTINRKSIKRKSYNNSRKSIETSKSNLNAPIISYDTMTDVEDQLYFDIAFNFERYFPHNNYQIVCQNLMEYSKAKKQYQYKYLYIWKIITLKMMQLKKKILFEQRNILKKK